MTVQLQSRPPEKPKRGVLKRQLLWAVPTTLVIAAATVALYLPWWH